MKRDIALGLCALAAGVVFAVLVASLLPSGVTT